MNAPRAMGWMLVGLLAWPPAATADVLRFMHTDLQGSVVAVTDESGAIIERRVYEPYGLPTAPIPDGPGYTGHDMDGETGLVYMQQRYYDPEVGRFLSIDPDPVDTGMAANFGRYHYAANSPYVYTDPDGEAVHPVVWGGIIGGATGMAIEGYSQYMSGTFSGRKLAVATGKGALVGAAITAGAMAGGALAISEGAGNVAVAITSTIAGAYSGGATNLVVAPAADIAAGNEMRSHGEYVLESGATAAGAIVGAGTQSAVTGALARAGASSNVAAGTGVVFGETAGSIATESLAPVPPPPPVREEFP